MNLAIANSFVIEVEQEVLGALLVGNDMRRVSSILKPEHFVEPFHRVLFDYMLQAFDRYGTVNPVVIYKLVPPDEAKVLGAKLGTPIPAYLANLAAGTVSGPSRIEVSARKVVEQWARLQLATEAGRLQAAANDAGSDPVALVTGAGLVFDDILSSVRAGPKRKTRVTLGYAAENAFAASAEAMQRGRGLTGITWGLTDVNRVTGGIQRRDLTLIAARPSMGKTTVGLSTAIRAAKSGIGVGFISLEMDAEKLAARAASDIAYDWNVQVPYADIIRGNIDKQGLEAVRVATQDIGKLPLWIEDQSGLSMTDIRVKTEALLETAQRAGKEIGALFLDHIGLIRPSSRYSGNRVNEVAEISAGLKTLAREFGIAVVALSQLSRALEGRNDKRPQLSDLRDSGAIEQDADTIVFLFREAYYLEREKALSADAELERTDALIRTQNQLEFAIAKQRNGPVTTVNLFADMACSAIRNGERQ